MPFSYTLLRMLFRWNLATSAALAVTPTRGGICQKMTSGWIGEPRATPRKADPGTPGLRSPAHPSGRSRILLSLSYVFAADVPVLRLKLIGIAWIGGVTCCSATPRDVPRLHRAARAPEPPLAPQPAPSTAH